VQHTGAYNGAVAVAERGPERGSYGQSHAATLGVAVGGSHHETVVLANIFAIALAEHVTDARSVGLADAGVVPGRHQERGRDVGGLRGRRVRQVLAGKKMRGWAEGLHKRPVQGRRHVRHAYAYDIAIAVAERGPERQSFQKSDSIAVRVAVVKPDVAPFGVAVDRPNRGAFVLAYAFAIVVTEHVTNARTVDLANAGIVP